MSTCASRKADVPDASCCSNDAVRVRSTGASCRERRLGNFDGRQRAVDLRENRAGRIRSDRGRARLTPRFPDLGETGQRLLQLRRAACQGAEPLARLRLPLLPELLLVLAVALC